ncbi:Uncharacterized protein Adt_35085 [Abeliophyllum distichum]|uniref:Uncharacterized protein n=1 Tax=Abeliophyllum distichum TaxID=126358 RepID=A0ABD1QDP7_9LAMI
MGLGHTTAWLLPYIQDASPRCLALPPGTRPNYSLAPSLPPRSIASLLGPPAWDSAKLQLGSFLTFKMHHLAGWPSHLGLGQTLDWLLPYLQGATLRCLALPPRTRPNFSMAHSLPPRSIASLLCPPNWDSALLQLGSSLTSKEHPLAAWPSHLGLGQTVAWLLSYLQGASPCYLALPLGTRKNYSLAPSLPPGSIALELGLPTWDSSKLQVGSSLTFKEHRFTASPFYLGLGQATAWLLPYVQDALPHCLALPPGLGQIAAWLLPYLQRVSPRCLALLPRTRPNCGLALPYVQRVSPRYLALPLGTRPNCGLALPLPPRRIASLLGPTTWDSKKLKLGSSLTSMEHHLAAWPSYMGLGHTLGSFLSSKKHRLAAWPSHLGLSQTAAWTLVSKKHHLAAWPSHLVLGQTAAWLLHYLQGASPCGLPLPPGTGKTTAWLLPYLQGASPCCLALPPGIRPYYSLAPPLPRRSIALLLGPPTWDSAILQLGSSLTSKEHRLTAWLSNLGLGPIAGESPYYLAFQPGTRPYCSLAPPLPPRSIASLIGPPTWYSAKLQLGSFLTSKEHRLAAWPFHLRLSQTAAWLLPYLQKASPRCLALPPSTRPNCSLAPPLPPRSIALRLAPTTWDWEKLQLGSSLTSKERRLAAWPSHLGLGHIAAWFLPYLQGASLHNFALPPGTRPNYSLAPSLRPRSIASLLGPPTCDSDKLQLCSFLTTKEHRLAAWPSHLGLSQSASWLLPCLQKASPRTQKNYSLPPPLPPRSIALLLGPPTWDSAILQLCGSLTSKKHRHTTSPFRVGLSQTTAWLLPYAQGVLSRCLALPPGTRPNLAPPLLLRSIALLLGPPTWDLAILQLGSSLISNEHRLTAWPSNLGLCPTTGWLLPYLQGASPHCFALPPGTRQNCSLAPPLPPRSITSLLGPPTLDMAKLQLGCSLTSKDHRLAAWISHMGLGQTTALLRP